MMISGHVKLIQDHKVVHECRNHLTANGAKMILANLNSAQTAAVYYPGNTSGLTVNLGSGSFTPSNDVTVLQTQKTIITNATLTSVYNDVTGIYDVIITAAILGPALTTAFGTDPVAEVGIFSHGPFNILTYAWTTTTSNVLALLGYISSPTDFDSANIDKSKSLTIEWRIRFTFAA